MIVALKANVRASLGEARAAERGEHRGQGHRHERDDPRVLAQVVRPGAQAGLQRGASGCRHW
ncbi:hypothetical protein [Nannocystis pusilla]|uniref:hypothetical protein n=1 Tax=Nannocystis pusilla TaxID=889268 RepID=UPI003DA50020